ncbi:squalene--hopene cyclase [bacterium]|nr:squalene--hopene cyclase [bacterium]
MSSNQSAVFLDRLNNAYGIVRSRLLAERNENGHWTGELSTSALSTATATMAIVQLCKHQPHCDDASLSSLIDSGLHWLAANQNEDGGWGDTVKSFSNISTTMLAHAVYHAAGRQDEFATTVTDAKRYVDDAGGVPAVIKRYGKDKTFSIPILTHCALAGLVDWKQISSLPFELACVPAKFYKTVRMPVVSYALPALIAIGQVKFHFRKPWNPISRVVRSLSINRSLGVLTKIQPPNGGFLEAAPLTSFVTMSLAAMGQHNHIVAKRGLQFLVDSVRPDGSWPIDTNLATWGTTLAVNALRDDLPDDVSGPILAWLLKQQYKDVHPFTNADPGGWAWTDLPGGVPDADDTPGAMLAVKQLASKDESTVQQPIQNANQWLLGLQNRDGGWPTFCRGWGTLPFDRSSADITAHAVRALLRLDTDANRRAIGRGFSFLEKVQRDDGSWYPLWFGNQHHPDEENPTYGTGRVLMAYRDAGKIETDVAQRGCRWLRDHQNDDGGWGGQKGIASTIEETSLAVEALLSDVSASSCVLHGLQWLFDQIEADDFTDPTPIGFYFAKLWYFERLYPLTFLASALNRSVEHLNNNRS